MSRLFQDFLVQLPMFILVPKPIFYFQEDQSIFEVQKYIFTVEFF